MSQSNTAGWDALYSLIIKAGGKQVHAGVFNGVNGATGEIVSIAAHHEYGAPRAGIVERSYIRSVVRERKAELAALMARVVKMMIQRKITEQKALELIGAWLAGAIKGRIVSGPFAPLKPSTIARKGSATPLIDTGQLKNTVAFIIVD